MRSTDLQVLLDELKDIMSEIQDTVDSLELNPTEENHAQEIGYMLNSSVSELEYFISGLDARDESDVYDEDGNLLDDLDSSDGTIHE